MGNGPRFDDRTNVLREMLQQVPILRTDGSRREQLAMQVREKLVQALVH
jgi:hypothetical protein